MRSFIVTSLGRSGTRYTSELFTALGLETGHELVFDWNTRDIDSINTRASVRESSWCAAPFLNELNRDLVILHQTRAPWATIRSSVQKTTLRKPCTSFLEHHAGFEYRKLNEWERWSRMYVRWHEMIEQRSMGMPYVRYRLEDMDAKQVTALMNAVGFEVSAPKIERVLSELPRNINGSKNLRKNVREIKTLELTTYESVIRLGRRYGYSDEELVLPHLSDLNSKLDL